MPKYQSQNPVLRRKVLQAYARSRIRGKSKRASMEFAKSIYGPKAEEEYVRRLRAFQRQKGSHLTMAEANGIFQQRDLAKFIRRHARKKHGLTISFQEASRMIDVFRELARGIPTAKRNKFTWEDFLKFFLTRRKEKGKRLYVRDLARVIDRMGKDDLEVIVRASMIAGTVGMNSPRSRGLFGPRVYELFTRAKKEHRLNEDSLQHHMLEGEFNYRLGAQGSIIPDPSELTRKQIREMVAGIAHHEFPPSLKSDARRKIRNWDALGETKRNEILYSMSMRELGNELVRVFDPHRRVIETGMDRTGAAQWVLDTLKRPGNRLFLATLAVKWYGPKPHKAS